VFDEEPLPAQDALRNLPNVSITPHLGFVEQRSYELIFGAAFQNVVDFFAGQPRNVLNPSVLI
jgi:D-3-phosphoglycerate dehydrogenase